VVFLDVETQNFFTEAGREGRFDHSDLKISFVGVYDNEKDETMSFWEDDVGELEKVVEEADRVVGYNIWAFDYGVMASYMDVDLWTLPTLDLMVAMRKVIGFRPKLDDLARANDLGSKLGKGADAMVYWQKGELDRLEKYCLEDVRLTYEVWRVGDEDGKLKYYDQSGFLQETPVSWVDGHLQRVDESVQERLF
jgi:DEAD/DEAH box helicase domain-containing protein